MSARWIVPITVAVLALHAWLLLGPAWPWLAWHWPPRSATPTVIQAVAIALSAPVQAAPAAAPAAPASTPAAAPPRPAKTPRAAVPSVSPTKAATSEAVPAVAAVVESTALPMPATSLAAEPDAHAATSTATPSVTMAGPQLHVQSASGSTAAWQLPDDGSALSSHMDLRFRVHGWVKGMEYHAQAQLSWHSDGQHYDAQQTISAFLLGSLRQRSQGRITAQGLQPTQFDDQRLTKLRSVLFDWPARLARFAPERPAAAIGAGAQDRLSVLLQLAAMLRSNPDLRIPGTRIVVPTLGSRSLQMWEFEVAQQDMLDLPAGTMPTLQLRRHPRPGHEEHTQLWLAPELGYAPVRIQMHENNGDQMELALRQWSSASAH